MPTFGSSMQHWIIGPDGTYLNHGTVGATPRRLLHEQQRIPDDLVFVSRDSNGNHRKTVNRKNS